MQHVTVWHGGFDAVTGGVAKVEQGTDAECFMFIGFDDATDSRCMVPALTTVRQPRMEIGRKAAEILLQMIRTPSQPVPRETVFCPEICVRETCLGYKPR